MVSLNTDPKTKSVKATFSFDVDPATVNESSFQLLEKASRNLAEYTITVTGKDVLLTLLDWPIQNSEYVLRIQNLKSIVGESLSSGVRRKIVFASSVASKLEITYPAMNEVISNLMASWKEIPVPSTAMLYNSYNIEISTDVAFHNIVKQMNVLNRTDIDISDLPKGQYYIRGKVDISTDYGPWSDIVTFLINAQVDPTDPNQDDDGVIYVPDISILTRPEDGMLSNSFTFEFDFPIDTSKLTDVVLIKRNDKITKITFKAISTGNYLEIIPDEGVFANCVYEIDFVNVVSADGKAELPNQKVKIATAVKPAYVSLLSVQEVVESCQLNNDKILYNIREASRFADYIIDFDHINIPFEVEQFVKYKAAHDCLLKYYIDRAALAGQKGQIGDVMFDNDPKMSDISDLLKELKQLEKFWMDAMRGYNEFGRAKPASAVKGLVPKIQTAVGTGGKPLQPVNPAGGYNRGV
jgi:hypothetical protein